MSCCGDKVKTMKNIVKGTFMRLLPASEIAKRRRGECKLCNKSTWFTLPEYLEWLAKNGIKIFKNFSQLEKLPLLEIKEHHTLAELYCSLCKCNVDGSSRVLEKQCPEYKWEGLEFETTQEYRKITWLICRQCEHNRYLDIRGVCAKSKSYFPIVGRHKPRQRTIIVDNERIIIKEMKEECQLGYWPSPEGEPAKNIPPWLKGDIT